MLPTSTVIVEPLLGQCVGAEAEVRQAEATADQAAEELQRMRKRIEASVLDDPRPFAQADTLAVHVNVDEAGASAGEGGPL